MIRVMILLFGRFLYRISTLLQRYLFLASRPQSVPLPGAPPRLAAAIWCLLETPSAPGAAAGNGKKEREIKERNQEKGNKPKVNEALPHRVVPKRGGGGGGGICLTAIVMDEPSFEPSDGTDPDRHTAIQPGSDPDPMLNS